MNHTRAMKFEWDEAKSETCFRERGFDFAYAAHAFFDPNRIVRADTRHSYGEDRYQLMGKIEQRLFVIAYTPRPGALRIISARKANQRETRHYDNATHHP
ncbi:MAG: BrnT family toxin [Halothiobacillaceae bacterium]